MGGWFYVDKSGQRQYEPLTDEQAASDLQALGAFTVLELAVSADPNADLNGKEYTEVRGVLDRAVTQGLNLAPNRREHWRGEAARIGLRLTEPAKPTKKGDDKPGDDKAPKDTGGSK